MGVVNLARVDERLIHGQVMMTLSQKAGSTLSSSLMKWLLRINSCEIYTKMPAVAQDKKTIVVTPEKQNFIGMNMRLKSTTAS